MTDPQVPRYCPMCNRRTETIDSRDGPFVATVCRECGHVHAVKERG